MDGRSFEGEKLLVEPTSKTIICYNMYKEEEAEEGLRPPINVGIAVNLVTGKILINIYTSRREQSCNGAFSLWFHISGEAGVIQLIIR